MPVGKRTYGPQGDETVPIVEMEDWDEWLPSPKARGKAVRWNQDNPDQILGAAKGPYLHNKGGIVGAEHFAQGGPMLPRSGEYTKKRRR